MDKFIKILQDNNQFLPEPEENKIKPKFIDYYIRNYSILSQEVTLPHLQEKLKELKELYSVLERKKNTYPYNIKNNINVPDNLNKKRDKLKSYYLPKLKKLFLEFYFNNNSYLPLNNILEPTDINIPDKITDNMLTDEICSPFKMERDCNDLPRDNEEFKKKIIDSINSFFNHELKRNLSGGSNDFLDIYYKTYISTLTCDLHSIIDTLIKILIYKNYFHQNLLDLHINCKFISKFNFQIILLEQIIFYVSILKHYLDTTTDYNWYCFILLHNYFRAIMDKNKNLKNDNNFYVDLLLIKKTILDTYFLDKMYKLVNNRFLFLKQKLRFYTGYYMGLLLLRSESFSVFLYNIKANDIDIIFGTDTCNGFIQNILQEIPYNNFTFEIYYDFEKYETLTNTSDNFFKLKQFYNSEKKVIIIKLINSTVPMTTLTIIIFQNIRTDRFEPMIKFLTNIQTIIGGSQNKSRSSRSPITPTSQRAPSAARTPSTPITITEKIFEEDPLLKEYLNEKKNIFFNNING